MHSPPTAAAEPPKLVPGLKFAHDRLPSGAVWLTLSGELDLATAARAAARIRRAQDESCVLICDLAELWFIDVTGLRVLVDAAAHAQRTGGRLLVANAPPLVPRMLRLLKLEHALEIPAIPPRTPSVRACTEIRPHAR